MKKTKSKAKKPPAKKAKVKAIKVVYGVPWIEVESGWGSRPEGYKLYLDANDCINDTNRASSEGAYSGGGGYLGPQRPLVYIEIPFDSLDEDLKELLKTSSSKRIFTDNYWSPKFTGPTHYIK